MKTIQLKHFFKATALAVALSSSMTTFAQSKNEVVAVVDNSVILKSDLEQNIAEIKHQLEAQKKPVPPEQYLQQQALDHLLFVKHNLNKLNATTLKRMKKA